MTPRENMIRAIEFRGPERLPVSGYGSQSDGVGVGYVQLKPPGYENRDDVDQWLCRWEKTEQKNMGQVKGHPLEDLAAMKDFPWPDGTDSRRLANMDADLAAIAADPARRDKYVTTSIFLLLWERMQALHGFENCMYDLMDDTPEIHELADRITQYNVDLAKTISRVAGGRIHGLSFTEDWGTQIDLHVSPELFGRFFVPRYKRIFGAIHEAGWHVWMHSCGKINKAIGMLAEAGVDNVELQQPLTNGIEELGRKYAGKVCFRSLCDIQKTLPVGDRAEVTRQSRELMMKWGTPQGGFILTDYGDEAAIGCDRGIKEFMLAEFRRQDPWANGLWQ